MNLLYCFRFALMSGLNGKFLFIEGIDTSVSLRDLITCFQHASSVRFAIERNMDPENMKAILGTP